MSGDDSSVATFDPTSTSRNVLLGTIGWLWVGVPFSYGLIQLILKIPALFNV